MKVALHTNNGKTFAYSNQEFAEIAKFKEGGEIKSIEVTEIDTIVEDHIEVELTDCLNSNTVYIRPTVNDGEETAICYDFNFSVDKDSNEWGFSFSIDENDFDKTDASNQLKKIVTDMIETKLAYL